MTDTIEHHTAPPRDFYFLNASFPNLKAIMEGKDAVGVITDRLDRLDRRMLRIESALNRLLEISGQPLIDTEDQEEHGDRGAEINADWVE